MPDPLPTGAVERLAEALLTACPGDDLYLRAYDRVRALAPVVAAIARETAAAELEAAAADHRRRGEIHGARRLLDRATALRAQQ